MFIEERISVCIRLDNTYSDNYDVEITQVASGAEYRRLIHEFPVRRFTVSYHKDRDDLYDTVMSLYHRCYGTFAGFRVKHLDDYSTALNHRDAPTATDQVLKLVSPNVYQLQKFYGLNKPALPGIGRPKRIIYKPVDNTTKIAINGVALASANYSVNITTGLVTIPTAVSTDVVTGGCQFDTPCRFGAPIVINHNHLTFRMSGTIELVELLNP